MKRIALSVGLCALALLAADKPADGPQQFTVEQQQKLTEINKQAAMLQQEERALTAERAVLQLRANQVLDEACRLAGGTRCAADTSAADPRAWRFTVQPDDKPAPADKTADKAADKKGK